MSTSIEWCSALSVSGCVKGQTWTFGFNLEIGPFFFPQFVLESSLGLRYSAPIIVAIIVVFSVLPIIYLQLMAWKRPLRVD